MKTPVHSSLSHRFTAVLLALSFLCAGVTIAQAQTTPEPELLSFRPQKLHHYSQLVVRLSHPSSMDRSKTAQFELSGLLKFADGSVEKGFAVKLSAAITPRGLLVHDVGEDLEFATNRRHALFVGALTMHVPLLNGTTKRFRIQSTTIDLFPVSLSHLANDFTSQLPLDPASALGIKIDVDPKNQSMTVAGYTRNGFLRARELGNEAKLLPGDRILSINGETISSVPVLSAVLKNSSSSGDFLRIHVNRGGTEHNIVVAYDVSIQEKLPSWLVQFALYLGCALFILLGFFAPFAGITSFVERRIAGRIQSRIGPNRVGPGGFLQWLADGLKTFQKEDLIPPDSQVFFFKIAPYFVMAGVFLTFVALPFSQSLIVADLNIGIFYILAITSVVVVGIILAGWSSNNKWSMLGGFRSAAQMISYEIPLGIAVLCVALLAGSLSLQDITTQQGAYPWEWNVFHNPAMIAVFAVFCVSSLAEGNRAPFDLAEAESELVSGYNTEYSGMRFLFFFFAEWGNLWVMSALMSLLFLGGWLIPGVSPMEMEASIWLQLLGLAVLTAKCLVLVFIIIWVRWTLPRVRIDQMMSMCWKFLIPISFAGFMITAAWLVFVPDTIETASRFILFGGSLLVFITFIQKVRFNHKSELTKGPRFDGKLQY
jgi:NADH-quinone oxidoreductase subunit H